MNLTTLSNKYNTKEKCLDRIEEIRWGGHPCCNNCGNLVVYRRKNKHLWHCNKCNKDSSPLQGTIFEASKMPLPKWFQLISLMLNAKKGISSTQISRDIGVTYKSAWYSAMRVRCAMLDWGEKLEGIVEMDETYVGGKPRKRGGIATGDIHTAAPPDNVASLSNVFDRNEMVKDRVTGKVSKRGRGTDKLSVVGIVERKGRVVAKVMSTINSENLLRMLKQNVDITESTLMTDDLAAYNKMDEIIERFVINHSKKIYANSTIHTNNIEGFWSIIKNGLRGQYHVLSKKYLPFYLAEFCYRFNRRKMEGEEAFDETVENAVVSEKELLHYKPTRDVKRIVYPRKPKKANTPRCRADSVGVSGRPATAKTQAKGCKTKTAPIARIQKVKKKNLGRPKKSKD